MLSSHEGTPFVNRHGALTPSWSRKAIGWNADRHPNPTPNNNHAGMTELQPTPPDLGTSRWSARASVDACFGRNPALSVAQVYDRFSYYLRRSRSTREVRKTSG